MIAAYLKMALRRLGRSRAYSLINIVGLSIGLAACFVILVYVSWQTSFDKHNDRLQDIYLVTSESPAIGWTEPSTPFALAPAAKTSIPGLVEAARWGRVRSTTQYKDRLFDERACIYADPEIFRILTIPLIEGIAPPAGTNADYLVISEKMARKYFGGKSPLGEILTIDCLGSRYELAVTGVMKDFPETSTARADLIGPLRVDEDFIAKIYRRPLQEVASSWMPAVVTYVLLNPSVSATDVDAKLQDLRRELHPPEEAPRFHLFPMKDVYFHSSSMVNNVFPQGNITNIYIYSTAAFLLLFVAAVNYLMLSLGRASLRTKEIGVRRVLGARRLDLFWQVSVEAVLVTLLALLPAVALVEIFLQKLTALLGTGIAGSYFHAWKFVGFFTAAALLVGLMVGIYVAFYLAGFNPVDILRKKMMGGPRKIILRRVLMATQMIIFLGLSLASLIIYRQLLYCREKDPGFDMSRLVVFYPEDRDFSRNFESAKAELRKIPGVVAVTGANVAPGEESRAVMKFPRKDNPSQLVTAEGMTVDRDFIETMGMKILQGESFAHRAASGASGAGVCVVNETFVREMGLTDPVGQEAGGLRIVGIVKDFNLHSLREPIVPLQIHGNPDNSPYIRQVIVRVASPQFTATLRAVEETLQKFNAGGAVEYETYDERIGSLYLKEQKFATVIGYAAGLAIIVASLGILGMSVFICQQRVKEIGIRKVMGASSGRIYATVVSEFLVLVLLSSLLGFPNAIYFVNKWLQNFAYRIEVTPWDIAAALVANLLVVLAVVTYQALKAARANPVESLRYE